MTKEVANLLSHDDGAFYIGQLTPYQAVHFKVVGLREIRLWNIVIQVADFIVHFKSLSVGIQSVGAPSVGYLTPTHLRAPNVLTLVTSVLTFAQGYFSVPHFRN